jgi:hypothetical protein
MNEENHDEINAYIALIMLDQTLRDLHRYEFIENQLSHKNERDIRL